MDDARKKQAAQQKNEHQDALNKEYRIIIEKLNPSESNKNDAYQSFEDISNDIDRINNMTSQMGDDSYHSKRAGIRIALQEALVRLEEPLRDNWHKQAPALKQAFTALENIKTNLHIIQPKAGDTTPKSAMVEVNKVIDRLRGHYTLAGIKDELIAPNAPANPEKTMLFLSMCTVSAKDITKALLENHLMQEITPEKKEELARVMKSLDKTQKERLKMNLIKATKYAIFDNDENYQSLLAQKNNQASLIPLIAILCISGSGKINQKTVSYSAWLKCMNKSKPSTTKSALTTFQEEGVEGIVDKIRGKRKAQKLKPGNKISDSDL